MAIGQVSCWRIVCRMPFISNESAEEFGDWISSIVQGLRERPGAPCRRCELGPVGGLRPEY